MTEITNRRIFYMMPGLYFLIASLVEFTLVSLFLLTVKGRTRRHVQTLQLFCGWQILKEIFPSVLTDNNYEILIMYGLLLIGGIRIITYKDPVKKKIIIGSKEPRKLDPKTYIKIKMPRDGSIFTRNN